MQAPGPVRPFSRATGGDLARPETLANALQGVDAVFLMWPLHTGAPLPEVVDVLKARVERVVFLGSGGVADLTMDEQEALIAGSGLEYAVIRPSTFAVNALWWLPQIRAGNVVRGLRGDLPLAMLHEADIAAVAVRALIDKAYSGTFTLTGPAAVTQAEQVRTIGDVLGRPLRWEEVTRPDARRQMLRDDFPESFVDVLLDAYETMPPPTLTTTVQDVTGVPARTFRQWVADHAAEFAA